MVHLRCLVVLDMILKVPVSYKIVHLAWFRSHTENAISGRSFSCAPLKKSSGINAEENLILGLVLSLQINDGSPAWWHPA